MAEANAAPLHPTQDEVFGYFESLSNWGRWGPDDELGTLNLITPAKRLEAAALVRDGVSIGCARPIVYEQAASDVRYPPLHFMIQSGDAPGATSAADYFGIATHGLTISHVDALSHQFWDGKLYNAQPASAVSSVHGATACSIETMKDGIVTRGVLLDIPRLRGERFLDAGDAIYPEELEAAEGAQGVRVAEGDALLVRTGWPLRRAELGPHPDYNPRPGLQAATLPWMRARGVAVAGADAAQDVQPSGYPGLPMPLHKVGIVAMGLCLLDNLQLEDLAEACAARGRWEFLFAVAPMRLRNGTASPATPLAVL